MGSFTEKVQVFFFKPLFRTMAAAMAVAPVDHHYHRTPIPHYIHTLFTFLMRAIFFILPFFSSTIH